MGNEEARQASTITDMRGGVMEWRESQERVVPIEETVLT